MTSPDPVSAYVSALEKLKVLASFAKTHPDTTIENLLAEVVHGDSLYALRWLNRDESAQWTPPPLVRVVELVAIGLAEAYFDTAAGQVRIDITQKGRVALAEGKAAAWDGKLLTAREAAEILSMLEHFRRRGESNSWEEDD